MPVKSLHGAKSRIDPDGDGVGQTLALGFFHDTVDAVLATERIARVVVVTHDAVVGAVARAKGCLIVDDTEHSGINAAAAWAVDQLPADGPVVVLVSDLPCLTVEAMTAVLDAADGRAAAFLADTEGTGTTMWLSARGTPVDSHFGPASAAAHRAVGAVDLADIASDQASLTPARRDVDTEADLAEALRVGVGPSTRDALAMIGSMSPVLVTALGRAADGSLEVADERGARHRVDWQVVRAAGFLDVRPGQRLVLHSGSVRLP